MDDATTITIEKRTWKRLNSRKEPGESFDDVVDRLLDDTEECNNAIHQPRIQQSRYEVQPDAFGTYRTQPIPLEDARRWVGEPMEEGQ